MWLKKGEIFCYLHVLLKEDSKDVILYVRSTIYCIWWYWYCICIHIYLNGVCCFRWRCSKCAEFRLYVRVLVLLAIAAAAALRAHLYTWAFVYVHYCNFVCDCVCTNLFSKPRYYFFMHLRNCIFNDAKRKWTILTLNNFFIHSQNEMANKFVEAGML